MLGGLGGLESGGRDDVGERQAAQAPAVVAGGEVGTVFGGHLAGAFAGRCGPQVGRRRERGRAVAGVGEGRGVGRVCVVEAGSGGLGAGRRAGGVAGRERSALGGAQGAGGRVDVAPGKAALGLFGTYSRIRGSCERSGRGGQRSPRDSIAKAMTASSEW